MSSQMPAVSVTKGPALVSADEVAGDDWLIEDVRPTVKRKRLDVDSVFRGTSATKKRRSAANRAASSKRHRVWITDDGVRIVVHWSVAFDTLSYGLLIFITVILLTLISRAEPVA